MKLLWPIKGIGITPGISISQLFGQNSQNYAPDKGHQGVDIGCPMNTPVYAAHNGYIAQAEDPKGYGHHIYCRNIDNTFSTIYGHLNSYVATTGQQVAQGQLIGYSGSSGNSTGPHLHFGYQPIPVNFNNGYSGCIDPMPFMKTRDFFVGWQKHPEKDLIVRFSSMDEYNTAKQQISSLFPDHQFEDVEFQMPLPRPPFPIP